MFASSRFLLLNVFSFHRRNDTGASDAWRSALPVPIPPENPLIIVTVPPPSCHKPPPPLNISPRLDIFQCGPVFQKLQRFVSLPVQPLTLSFITLSGDSWSISVLLICSVCSFSLSVLPKNTHFLQVLVSSPHFERSPPSTGTNETE